LLRLCRRATSAPLRHRSFWTARHERVKDRSWPTVADRRRAARPSRRPARSSWATSDRIPSSREPKAGDAASAKAQTRFKELSGRSGRTESYGPVTFMRLSRCGVSRLRRSGRAPFASSGLQAPGYCCGRHVWRRTGGDRAVSAHGFAQRDLRSMQEKRVLLVIDHVGERPAFDVGMDRCGMPS